MTDRSIAQEETEEKTSKRRQIVEAAVRVFAAKGYHGCRVSDVAVEAGVAHGLIYHYFSSKEELLETIFRDTWSELLEAMHGVEESGQPAAEQLRQIAAILLRSWRRNPDLVRVLVREVARSPAFAPRVNEIGQAFEAIERIIVSGQDRGQLRGDLDARLASWIFYGALEEILTGWVLGRLPDGDEEVARAERTVVELITGGLRASEAARALS